MNLSDFMMQSCLLGPCKGEEVKNGQKSVTIDFERPHGCSQTKCPFPPYRRNLNPTHCLYKHGLPTGFCPGTFLKSWAGWQHEKNNILAKIQTSHVQGNFENCTYNMKADMVPPHNVFIMTHPLEILLQYFFN